VFGKNFEAASLSHNTKLRLLGEKRIRTTGTRERMAEKHGRYFMRLTLSVNPPPQCLLNFYDFNLK